MYRASRRTCTLHAEGFQDNIHAGPLGEPVRDGKALLVCQRTVLLGAKFKRQLWSSILSVLSVSHRPHEHPTWGASRQQTLCQEVAYLLCKVLLYRFHEWQEMGDIFLVSCVVFCLHVCLCTTCMPSVHGSQKRTAPSGLRIHDLNKSKILG